MRWAKSYSIVDHRLLHGGYLQKLSHEALVLYLFLIVVGDKNGRSFYAETTIGSLLRLTPLKLDHARSELVRYHLIIRRPPDWWVQNIPESANAQSQTKDHVSKRCPRALLSADPLPIGDITKKGLKALFKHLGEKDEKDIPT